MSQSHWQVPLFVGGGRRTKPLATNEYDSVERRELFATYVLQPGDWTSGKRLFVWGRGGSAGGFSASKPNHQTFWTQVTSGTGNTSGFTDQGGLWHMPGDTVRLRTFQYRVGPTAQRRLIPATSDIQFCFSIFGTGPRSSVIVERTQETATALALFPNPAGQTVAIQITVVEVNDINISVHDMLGREVLRTPGNHLTAGSYRLTLDVALLTPGRYYVRVVNGSDVATKPLTVNR